SSGDKRSRYHGRCRSRCDRPHSVQYVLPEPARCAGRWRVADRPPSRGLRAERRVPGDHRDRPGPRLRHALADAGGLRSGVRVRHGLRLRDRVSEDRMTNHPGDPRSNVLGEQPFDHGGWPQHTVTPTVAPPPPGNARNYVPYRGAEQHGVPNQRDPRADIEKPFASEQDALDRANDPTITPRDLVPVKPVPVTIVHRPDLLHRRRVHTATYLVRAGSPMLIAPADPLRTRLVITSAAAGDDDVRV